MVYCLRDTGHLRYEWFEAGEVPTRANLYFHNRAIRESRFEWPPHPAGEPIRELLYTEYRDRAAVIMWINDNVEDDGENEVDRNAEVVAAYEGAVTKPAAVELTEDGAIVGKLPLKNVMPNEAYFRFGLYEATAEEQEKYRGFVWRSEAYMLAGGFENQKELIRTLRAGKTYMRKVKCVAVFVPVGDNAVNDLMNLRRFKRLGDDRYQIISSEGDNPTYQDFSSYDIPLKIKSVLKTIQGSCPELKRLPNGWQKVPSFTYYVENIKVADYLASYFVSAQMSALNYNQTVRYAFRSKQLLAEFDLNNKTYNGLRTGTQLYNARIRKEQKEVRPLWVPNHENLLRRLEDQFNIKKIPLIFCITSNQYESSVGAINIRGGRRNDDAWVSGSAYKKYWKLCTRCETHTQTNAFLNHVDDEGETHHVCNACSREMPRAGQLIQGHGANPITSFDRKFSFRFAKGEQIPKNEEALAGVPFLGVELEATPRDEIIIAKGIKGAQQYVAQRVFAVVQKKHKMAIITEDGSIRPWGGIEIVTVPMTHRCHVGYTIPKTGEVVKGMWDDFFAKEGPATVLSGWVNNGEKVANKELLEYFKTVPAPVEHMHRVNMTVRPYAGIHVHVSRSFFSSLHLGKVLVFMNDPKNAEFIKQIAGRSSDYARYSEKKLSDGYYAPRTTATGEERRQAVNTATGKNTIEFRIFRSNCSKRGFLKNLDFVQAVSIWTKEASNTDLTFQAFLKYVNDNRGTYKHLSDWLVAHKHLSTIHKFNPKFQVNKEYAA